MTVKNETQRIFLRGENVTLAVSFFSDMAATIPIVPLDVAIYPAYTIYDIDNQPVQSGVGQLEASPGRYKTEFLVPTTAPLSSDMKRWRVEWTVVSTDNRQFDFVEEFDVRDITVTASETREISFVSLAGQTYRAILRMPEQPLEVFLNVYHGTNANTLLVNNVGIGSGLQKVADGDSIVYYYDIDGSLIANNCTYALIWSYRGTLLEPLQFVYQVLTSVTPNVLGQVTALRHLIDKFQKRLGTVQAYEDSHLVEYLVRGTELVNSVYPTTYFNFGNLPSAFNVYHILFSAWYGLQAQGMLETDLGFSFSGQSVTLEYDHASQIADLAGRWQEFISSTLPAAKMAFVRRTSPIGNVSGRQMSWRHPTFSYKVSSIPADATNVLGSMGRLGLLW
jgi:hypothetical protein